MPDKLSAERAGKDESRKNIQIIPDSSQHNKRRDLHMLSRITKYILMILVVIGFIGIGLVIEQSSAIGFSLLAYCLGLVIGLRSAVALISLNTGKTRSFPDVTLKKSGYAVIAVLILLFAAIAGWTAYCLGCFMPEGFETAVMAYIAGFGISCIAVSTCFYLQRYLPHEENPDET
ncbi:MAG TPA: hypothetical protein O0X65_00630 [Methanocorpusculum sp.]|nr:hypothetical protein [Methanocorpusculum sp.]